FAAGCPSILKPSPWAPSSCQVLAEQLAESDWPPGAVAVLPGDGRVGQTLVEDNRVRVIAMTGSTPTGRHIAGIAAPRFARMQLELGANNPAIVLPDADPTTTATALASGMTKLSGQWCEAPRRALVFRRHASALVDALVAELEHVAIGSSLREDTQ